MLAGVTLGGTGSFRPATSDARLPGSRPVPVERASTIAEYEAYPEDAAEFTLPRIGRGTCAGQANAPVLVTISRRGGGFHVNRGCFDGTSFVPVATVGQRTSAQAPKRTGPMYGMPRKAMPALLPPARPASSPATVPDPAAEAAEDAPSEVGSEYRYDVSMPWLTATGGLVRRCRNSLQHTTGGSFVSYPEPARYAGCRPGGRATDPDVVTMVPVPGELGDRIPAIGIETSVIRHIDADGTLDRVGRQGDIGCMRGARGGSCATPIPRTCPGDDGGAFYRWSALPAALTELPPDAARGPLVAATIFARGCRDEGDYQTLKSATALLDGRGWVARSRGGAFGPLMSWRVPETAEPVLSIGAGFAQRLVSLHAVPVPHSRFWLKAGNIALALGCASVLVALVLLLRLTRGSLGWSAVAAVLAALLLGFHSAADRIVGDGFTRDAELSVYSPNAGAPEVRMLLHGRAWLQQRTPVVADGNRALI